MNNKSGIFRYDGADVRELLINACNQWMSAVGSSPFLGGQQPTLADLVCLALCSAYVRSFH